jgi:tRNA A-37 threonylcarbamoyl transferase component Bud32
MNAQAMYAKLYVHHQHGEQDWQHEVDGHRILKQHGIATAELVYAGELPRQHAWIVIYQALEPSILFREAWCQADSDERQQLLGGMIDLLVAMHDAGLMQKNLNLNNILLKDDTLYILDAGDVRNYPQQLEEALSLDNLALLFAQFLPAEMVYFDDALEHYLACRNMQLDTRQVNRLRMAIHRKRLYRKRKHLEKAFRECSRFISSSSLTRYVMLDREFDGDAVRNLLLNPDAAMSSEDAYCMKAGNTCTISRKNVSQHGLVIKRYNIKHTWHGIKRALRRSRAAVSWENAHRLIFLGIPTARPIALLEYRLGSLRRRAYLVMEYVEGPSCLEYFNDTSISEQDKHATAHKVAGLFKQLQSNKISHGDMKARNIIIHAGRPVLIDLDAMQEYRSEATFRRAMNKDINRFFANWQEQPTVSQMFTDAFRAAGIQMPVQTVRAKR